MFWKRQPVEPSQSVAVAALQARVADVESEMRRLRLEWAEAHDKVFHLLKRTEARARNQDPPGTEPPGPALPAGVRVRRGL